MNIPEFSVDRKITILMLTLIVCLFGVISFVRIGIDMIKRLTFSRDAIAEIPIIGRNTIQGIRVIASTATK